MKEIFRDCDTTRVELYRTTLEAAGIACFVYNAATQQAIVAGVATAFFPLPEFFPTLRVLDDEDYPAAMEILRDMKSSILSAADDWACLHCAALVPGHFEVCWNCETSRATPSSTQ